MGDTTNFDPATLLKLLGDTFIPVPWARAAGGETTRAALKDGGNYPATPPGYTESFGNRAAYSAVRLGASLFITAEGTLNNANEFADIRHAPIRIYPPAFDLLIYRPGITLPMTRPFRFTVRVAYPTAPQTVQIRDAQGSQHVKIDSVALPGPLSGLVSAADAAGEGFGLGDSLEEAVSAAIATIPAEPSIPDALHVYQIVDSGKMIGGFVGLNVYYARVSATSR